MCCPAASSASGIRASWPIGTRLTPCAAVGHGWASPPSHPPTAQRVWSSGCKRSRGSTSRNVRPVVLDHWCGSRCLLSLPPLLVRECSWRRRALTRHEPARDGAVLPREVCHTVLTDPRDGCAPMPPPTRSARLDGLMYPAPDARLWGLPRRPPTSRPPFGITEGG
jgi:hypothetical protein